MIPTQPRPNKKPRQQSEMRIQADCVRWAWNERPETRRLLFHVQNELDRPDANAMLGARRRAEGIVRGVSDLILLIVRGPYHGLMIEMKRPDGYQSSYQREWQKIVEAQGYKYVVCRSLEQFQIEVDEYLNLK